MAHRSVLDSDQGLETYYLEKKTPQRALILLFGVSVLFLSTSCSLDAHLIDLMSSIERAPSSSPRENTDFLSGESITTPQGYRFQAVFGETSFSVKSLNESGWKFDGVFYE